MMIRVERYKSTDDATLSRVYIDGRFECFGLEDEYRAEKVPGETRIPAGTYDVTLRREGGFHQRYSQKFGVHHHGMLWVRNVPGFEYVLIHIGNTDDDTAGCLLVGQEADEKAMRVLNSTVAYKALYSKAWPAAQSGRLTIVFEDKDGRAGDA